ncbi:hypothetical protein [Bradyrhizobium guangdongense]|nr:hypothetical protein [Bradyrhizobium guangdongense]
MSHRSRGNPIHRRAAAEVRPMFDIIMLALGFGFFALAVGYTYACERL